MRTFAIFLSFVFGLLLSQFVGAQENARGIVGKPAPKRKVSQWHQLPKDQNDLNIEDYKGKVTYLYFFQSWCPGCHSSGFPTLKKLNTSYAKSDDVKFVAIQTTFEGYQTNNVDQLARMSKRYDLKIPFGQSEGTSGTPDIMNQYRSGGTPWVIIIDKQGVVRFNDFHIKPEKAQALIEKLRSTQ